MYKDIGSKTRKMIILAFWNRIEIPIFTKEAFTIKRYSNEPTFRIQQELINKSCFQKDT